MEVPGERPILLRPAGRIGHLFRLADVDGLVARPCLFETIKLGFGENFLRVHQLSGAGNKEI
jgi:hypothetical protein